MIRYFKQDEAVQLASYFEAIKSYSKTLNDKGLNMLLFDYDEQFYNIMKHYLPKLSFRVPVDINSDGVKSFTELEAIKEVDKIIKNKI